MRRIYGEELKRIQLEILDVVADFCDAHGIGYWIDSGTLLGAVRHKGYIPWDDDIDVGMLRPEYERFSELFNQEQGRYRFCCIDKDPDFLYPYGKVLDTDTVLYEPDRKGNKLSINIDIFPYDYVPDGEEAERMYDRRDRCRYWHSIRTNKNRPAGRWYRRWAVYGLRFAMGLIPKNYFVKALSKNAQTHKEVQPYVGNFTGWIRTLCKTEVLASFVELEFEGKRYKAPVGYDSWLRHFYGDYMQLPPEEKRCSHHSFEAYVQEQETE